MSSKLRRFACTFTAVAALSLSGAAPALAKNSQSQGHGVKCGWILDHVVGNANYWTWYCWKGA